MRTAKGLRFTVYAGRQKISGVGGIIEGSFCVRYRIPVYSKVWIRICMQDDLWSRLPKELKRYISYFFTFTVMECGCGEHFKAQPTLDKCSRSCQNKRVYFKGRGVWCNNCLNTLSDDPETYVWRNDHVFCLSCHVELTWLPFFGRRNLIKCEPIEV